MADFVQDEMNVNLNSVTQLLADVTMDYIVINKLLPMAGMNPAFDLSVSSIYHLADEIIFPALVDMIEDTLNVLPLIGGWLSDMIHNTARQGYVKVILRLILIGILQKSFAGRTDFVQMSVLMLSTYTINFATEIDAVSGALDWEFAV